jgi:hypothetical protein
MAAKKQSKSSSAPEAPGADEVQSERDAARERGYEGSTSDDHPNEAYSLQSGPDSPGNEPKEA